MGGGWQKHVTLTAHCVWLLYKTKDGGTKSAIGTAKTVLVALASLADVFAVIPGSETCLTPAWDAWKEFDYMKTLQNPAPEPTSPPFMKLRSNPAHYCHMTHLMQASSHARDRKRLQ
jgi:hypothetical protein